jgi:replicative DNA helicase
MSSTKSNFLEELLPHDKFAEQAVLGSVIIRNSVFTAIIDSLSASDFFSPAHQRIYQAMLA